MNNPLSLSSLTVFERGVFAKIVEQASDDMSNNGCNDVEVEVTEENYLAVVALIHKVANDPDDVQRLMSRARPGSTIILTDWILLSLLKRMLLQV